MKESFVIEFEGGRVRIHPFAEGLVGIEFLDRTYPPIPGVPRKLPPQPIAPATPVGEEGVSRAGKL